LKLIGLRLEMMSIWTWFVSTLLIVGCNVALTLASIILSVIQSIFGYDKAVSANHGSHLV